MYVCVCALTLCTTCNVNCVYACKVVIKLIFAARHNPFKTTPPFTTLTVCKEPCSSFTTTTTIPQCAVIAHYPLGDGARE